MPSPEQILAGLTSIANTWTWVAIFWHAVFGIIIVAAVFGSRPRRRAAGFLLGLSFVSVSAAAWSAGNPFNGVVFALLAVLVIVLAVKLPCAAAETAPLWALIPGALMAAFGWIYPHFLETQSFLPYLYSAPTGLIPCPTLSIAIGLALILNGLGSRALCLTLGIAGLFYGLVGVLRLHVMLDAVLLAGAAVILVRALTLKPVRG